jgi:pyrroloquinoline-quinone synthase
MLQQVRPTPAAAGRFEAALRAIGAERYHVHHPFHHLLHDGRLSKGQVQAWALNRYYYQCSIPAKDASLLARLDTTALRREWRRRLEDHDGDGSGPGGVERWLALTDGLGLDAAMSLARGAAAGGRASPWTPTCISCASARCWRPSPPR